MYANNMYTNIIIGLRYANMINGVERLKSMVTEHYQQICPENVARQVPPVKSK